MAQGGFRLHAFLRCQTEASPPVCPLPHFNNACFCGPGFGARFIVLCFQSFPGYLGAGVRLSAHLRAVSFALRLRAAGTQLPVEQRAPGALHLGLLQTLQGLERHQPQKSAVVVALMVRQEPLEDFRRAALG